MPRELTTAEAEAALAAVTAFYADAITEYGYPKPKLYEPGFHANGWIIGWEEGPYEWTYTAYDDGLRIPGVFFEPQNHWALAIYPSS